MLRLALAAFLAALTMTAEAQTSATVVRTILNPVPSDQSFYGLRIWVRGRDFAVGAPLASMPVQAQGLAHFYPRGEDNPVTLVSPAPGIDFAFGFAGAFTGNTLFITEPLTTATVGRTGRVYVYNTKSLSAAPSIIQNPVASAGQSAFGTGFHVAGKNLVVGDAFAEGIGGAQLGAVRIVNRKSGDLVTSILPPSIDPLNPGLEQWFGYNVVGDKKRISVGAISFSRVPSLFMTGAAFLFGAKVKGTTPPPFLGEVLPATAAPFQNMGFSQTVCGGDIAVGVPFASGVNTTSNVVPGVGAVQIATAGGGFITLMPPVELHQPVTGFGYVLAADKRLLYVGAPGLNQSQGAVFVYDRQRGYRLVKIIYSPEFPVPGQNLLFGSGIAPYGKNLLIGATGKDFGPILASGAVYEVEGVSKAELK